jgi:hypothetical protein
LEHFREALIRGQMDHNHKLLVLRQINSVLVLKPLRQIKPYLSNLDTHVS